ncbi:MAG TPA: hypothetical protein VKZ57_10230 [Sphingobacterium sp.]|nr:hypothetical protein [Sphingobacterium sp.]
MSLIVSASHANLRPSRVGRYAQNYMKREAVPHWKYGRGFKSRHIPVTSCGGNNFKLKF